MSDPPDERPPERAPRRRSTLSPRGYTGPLSIHRPPEEPPEEPPPPGPDPFKVMLGPGALVMFGLAAVVAVFPLGFILSDPPTWVGYIPMASSVLMLVAIGWSIDLRRRGEVPIDRGIWVAVLGLIFALFILAAGTAWRMMV